MDKQQIVLVSGVLLLTAVFGVFRYKPLMQQRVALDETIAQNQSTLQEIQTKEMKLPELAEQIKRMQTQTAVFDAKIPAGRSFADLWRQIADLMNQCRLTDQLVQPGQPIETEQLGTIPLTLACSGTTQDIYAFFRTIEQWDRLIRFEQVELSNDNTFGGCVKLNAKARLYYQAEQKQG